MQYITYTVFNKVKTIEQGDCNLSFTYGHDYARRKTVLHKKGPVVMTKYFIGNYEQKEDGLSGEVSKISYIMGGDGLAAIHIFDNSGSKMLYVHKDHLGSIQCLTNDNTSNNYGIVQEYSYDAWGMRTHLKKAGFNHDYSYKDLCRGYTGHEHLHEFGLINMNGRLYDPLLGRFLSPDNYVQFPNYTQNYNRFAYCLNNPLIYTDPTGQTIVGNFFKWVKKNTWDEFWGAANNFAQWADQNGIPAAGYGYNSGLGTYHYFGYSGNIYHSQVRGMNNAPQVVENAVSEARQENNNGMIAPNGDYYPYSFQGKMPDGKYWHGCMACHHPDGAYVPWMEIGGYHQLSGMIFTSVLGYGIGEVASSLALGTKVMSKLPNLGRKLDFIFGKATGNTHNIQRSTDMLRSLNRIGIYDDAAGRSLLRGHLNQTFNTTKGVLQPNGRFLRESLLMGPRGGVQVNTIWDGDKLITIMIKGGF